MKDKLFNQRGYYSSLIPMYQTFVYDQFATKFNSELKH